MSAKFGLIAIFAGPFLIFILGPIFGINTAEVLAFYACLQLCFLGLDFAKFRGKITGLLFALHMKIDAIGVMLAQSIPDEAHSKISSGFDEMIADLKAREDIALQADKLGKSQRRRRRRGREQ